MSYSICRIAKIKASGVTGIQIHDQREKDGVSHTNEDIDWSKTAENVSLLEQTERFRTVVANRIDELNLKRKPRSDATVMCQALVTSDNDFFKSMTRQEQTEFFRKSLDFIKERYGEQNLVSATIHYDERTPHMHINFVPVTVDGRLSAKDLFSPKSLRVLQNDYNRFVREQGYDLERGEIDSKTKHLDVEMYKVETKYKQLKAKEQELERLEKIDTVVGLEAEKGKLAYSTKEVDAIKEQNRALKLESHRKDEIIKELQSSLDKAEKRLIQVQKAVEGSKVPVNRLKDLESENRALESLRKNNQYMDKILKQFDRLKNQAYTFGNGMAECKEHYHNYVDERERLIQRANSLEKIIKDYGKQTEDISRLKQDISSSLARETALRAELEGLNGIFKKKAREDCQNRLKEQEMATERLTEQLKAEHGTDYRHINDIISTYKTQQTALSADKQKVIERTSQVEQRKEQLVHLYKYQKGLSDIQLPDFRKISDRISSRVEFRPGEERTFRITQADRLCLLDEYRNDSNIDSNILEKCKENFEKQNALERQERQDRKVNPAKLPEQEQNHARGGRSR